MTKRIAAILLTAAMLISLCACGTAAPEAPTPTPTAAVEIEGLELWQEHMLALCNMDYDGFIGYWDTVCCGYYGDDLKTVLTILSSGAKPFLDLNEKNTEIEDTRLQYAQSYGDDWHFSVISSEREDLDEYAASDFALELNSLADGIDVLLSAADAWNDAGWSEFALDHGCSVDDAKRLVEAYREIAALCRDASVTEAMTLSVTLELTGDGTKPLTKTESFTVYCVNGVYVTEPIVDYTYALINLVF